MAFIRDDAKAVDALSVTSSVDGMALIVCVLVAYYAGMSQHLTMCRGCQPVREESNPISLLLMAHICAALDSVPEWLQWVQAPD